MHPVYQYKSAGLSREFLAGRRAEFFRWLTDSLAAPRESAVPPAQGWKLKGNPRSSTQVGWLEIPLAFENGSEVVWHIEPRGNELRIELVLTGRLNEVARNVLVKESPTLMGRADGYSAHYRGEHAALRYSFYAPYLLESAAHQEGAIVMLEDATSRLSELLLLNVNGNTVLGELPELA